MSVSRFGRKACGLMMGLCLGLLGPLGSAWAGDYTHSPQVDSFMQSMTQEYGFAPEQLSQWFSAAERKQSILDAISRPAERVKPWSEYRPIFITQARIEKGADFWRRHADALTRAQWEYGVPAEIIVAIIGVETFYGSNTGNYRVIDALSTLGFDYPPRSEFFLDQLRQFLLLSREQQRDPLSLKGSYAGAMGLPQFMPSSFRAYAVDFDADGKIDIWNDPDDAIGSVANYFKRHGWQTGQPVVALSTLGSERAQQGLTEGLEPQMTVGQLRQLGWRPQSISGLVDEMQATAFRLDGDSGAEYWLGLPNFYVITRYNRSNMYAMAVYQLAQALVAARGSGS